MYWVAKASLQKVLGYLPAGDRINYLLQRKVTKGLPVNGQVFREKVLLAVQHFNSFREHCPAIDIPTATFYEFGAGWDLIGPLTYYALGIEHQTLVDIRPNIRYDLINDTLLRLSEDKDNLEQITGYSFRAINASPIASIAELKERFGITYLAPLDARDTNLQAESYDFISNTSTLEHIPEPDILKILEECRRLLKSAGILSSVIDLQDHYSYHDSRISYYNFLKFSDTTWRFVNSSLHFQNRLRYPDYMQLFGSAGLEVIAQSIAKPTSKDLEVLKSIKLSSRFQGKYSLEALGTRVICLVSRRVATI